MPDDLTLEALWREFAAMKATVAAMQPNFARLEHRIENCENEGQNAAQRLEEQIKVLSRESHATTTQVAQVQRTVSSMDLVLDGLTNHVTKFMAFLEKIPRFEQRLETTSDNVIKVMTSLDAMKEAENRGRQWKQVWLPALCGAAIGACATVGASYLQAWLATHPH